MEKFCKVCVVFVMLWCLILVDVSRPQFTACMIDRVRQPKGKRAMITRSTTNHFTPHSARNVYKPETELERIQPFSSLQSSAENPELEYETKETTENINYPYEQ